MRFLYSLLPLFLCATVVGQSASSVSVEYIFFKQQQDLAVQQNYLFDGMEAYWTEVVGSSERIDWSTNDDGSMHVKVNLDRNGTDGPKHYLNHSTQTCIAELFLSDEKFTVIDEIPKLEWTMTQKTKIVAEYTCYSATTHFRGRRYEAFFTPEIPISSGPYKLGGLPGLILELAADDGKFTWNCKSISKLTEAEAQLISPLTGNQQVSWLEYQKLALELLQRGFKKLEASGFTVEGEANFDEDTMLELPEDHN